MSSQEDFYNSVAVAFFEPSELVVESASDEYAASAIVGGRLLDIIKNLLASIDVSSLTREQFTTAAGMLFDNFIAPLLASTPAGMIATPFVRALFMRVAGQFYDNHSGPHPVPNPTA